MGRLAGIARHDRPKGPMQVVNEAEIRPNEGVVGDFRGAMRGKPYKRQVTLIERSDWEAAMAEVGADIPWQERRANLLVAIGRPAPHRRRCAA
jgi:hypothetical protein